MDLSEGETLSDDRRATVIARARELIGNWKVGYMIVDTDRATSDLVNFAIDAFGLTLVASDGPYVLYRTALD